MHNFVFQTYKEEVSTRLAMELTLQLILGTSLGVLALIGVRELIKEVALVSAKPKA